MRTGLIGERLGHSYSKDIHEQLQPFSYELIELNQQAFEEFMTSKEFDGINVTIPYKQKVIPYLDYIDERAKRIGAVNCIVNRNGELKGYNTDYQGIVYMLEHHHLDVYGKTVAILGSGGTSHTAMCVMKDLGATNIYRISRSHKQGCITYEELYAISESIEVIINTTPVGMFPHVDEVPLPLDSFVNLAFIVDVIFNPLHTKWLITASQLDIPCVGGLEMLVAQAVYASELFHNVHYDLNSIEKITKQIAHDKTNIVLIGMPTSGKSTIARKLSEYLHRPLFDIDSMIEERTSLSIPQIFEKQGESYFRKLEHDITLEACSLNGGIISCGGGVIKTQENQWALRSNGLVFFIDRPLALLQADTYRPLANDRVKLTKLYEERLPIYQEWCDFHILNDSTIENCVNAIWEVFKL